MLTNKFKIPPLYLEEIDAIYHVMNTGYDTGGADFARDNSERFFELISRIHWKYRSWEK